MPWVTSSRRWLNANVNNGSPANVISNLQNLKGGLTFAGVNGRPRTSWPFPKNSWGPRLGAAYQVSDRLVLRTGGGLYYANPNNDPQRTSGFSTSTSPIAEQLGFVTM